MPSTATDRLNGLTTSVAVKAPCRVATTAAITLSGLQTIDGVALAAGDRVLVKNQSSAVDNGVWVAGSGTWSRATDFNGSLDAVGGTLIMVTSGTVNANSYWQIDGYGEVVIGTDSIVFETTSGNLSLQADLAAQGGSAIVGFLPSGTGARARTAQAKMRDVLHATDFDVVGDGTTDDTTALQLAINEAASSGRTLLLPAQVKCGALTVPANTGIQGVGKKTAITAKSGSYNMFTITGSDVTIENLYIADAAKSGGWDFIIACGTNTLRYIELNNIVVYNSYGLLTDSGTGTDGVGAHIVTRVIDVYTAGHRGPGVQMTRGYAYQFFKRVSIDYVTVSASDYTGFSFDPNGMGAAAGGMLAEDCVVLGTCGTYNNANQHGWEISNAAAVELVRCAADTVAGSGFIFDTINTIKMYGGGGSLCGGDGMTLTGVFNSDFDGVRFYGRNYLTPDGAGTDACRVVSGCYTLNFTGCTFAFFGRHGFNKAAAQTGAIRLTGCYFNSNGLAGVGYGINDTGNSALSVISGGFNGNAQGNGNLQGNLSYYGLCQIASGAGNQSGGPGPLTF